MFTEQITNDDNSVHFYTGFPNRALLLSTFDIVKNVAERMRYHNGSKKETLNPQGYLYVAKNNKPGPSRKLILFQEVLMTLVRLRLNIPEQMLADSFGISSSTVASFATQTWIDLLYHELKFLIKWPSKEQIMNLPNAFTQFSKTRAIIDCTEYFIQKPQSPAAQSQSWSDYKHSNTFKQLVGISPNGAFIFLSPLYSGCISDRNN